MASNQSTLMLMLRGNPENIDASTISTALDLLAKLVRSFLRLSQPVRVGEVSRAGLTQVTSTFFFPC